MRGFTLLEVMVALAIFATLAAAVLSASQYALKYSMGVEQRVFAAWLADNQLNQLRLQSAWPIGQQQFVLHMDRRDWLVRQSITASREPRLLKVEIEVSLVGNEQILYRALGWMPSSHE
jgi:general secretion pathway protein I